MVFSSFQIVRVLTSNSPDTNHLIGQLGCVVTERNDLVHVYFHESIVKDILPIRFGLSEVSYVETPTYQVGAFARERYTDIIFESYDKAVSYITEMQLDDPLTAYSICVARGQIPSELAEIHFDSKVFVLKP